MKQFLVLLCLAAVVHSFALPMNVLSTGVVTQAPDVVYQLSSFWVTNVTIGTPGQTFTLAVDTLGSVLWAPDIGCNVKSNFSTLPCYGKHLFDSWNSSTYNEGFAYLNTDHLGFIEGIYGYDQVNLGSIANQTTTAQIRWIQAEQALPLHIAHTPGIDGVLGLAGAANVHASVADQFFFDGAWSKNVVTLWLENNGETSDNGSEGAIYYGDYDPLHCNYSYSVPNTDSSIYKFTTTNFKMTLGGSTVVTSQGNRQALLDSTSPYFSAPKIVVQQILGALGFNSSVTAPTEVDCGFTATVNMTLSTARGDQVIQGVNLVIPQSNGKCLLALAEAPNGNFGSHFELGAPFFRGRCTYLDRGQQTIGFGYPGKRVPKTTNDIITSQNKE